MICMRKVTIAIQDRLASHNNLADFIRVIIFIAHLYRGEKRDRQIKRAGRHIHDRPRRCHCDIRYD